MKVSRTLEGEESTSGELGVRERIEEEPSRAVVYGTHDYCRQTTRLHIVLPYGTSFNGNRLKANHEFKYASMVPMRYLLFLT